MPILHKRQLKIFTEPFHLLIFPVLLCNRHHEEVAYFADVSVNKHNIKIFTYDFFADTVEENIRSNLKTLKRTVPKKFLDFGSQGERWIYIALLPA